MSSRTICWLPPRILSFEVVGVSGTGTRCASTPAVWSMAARVDTVFVVSGKADHRGLRAQSGDVHGDVCCASRLLAAPGGVNNGYWRFGRDTVHAAVDVLVQHDVADDEDVFTAPSHSPTGKRFRGVELYRCAPRCEACRSHFALRSLVIHLSQTDGGVITEGFFDGVAKHVSGENMGLLHAGGVTGVDAKTGIGEMERLCRRRLRSSRRCMRPVRGP